MLDLEHPKTPYVFEISNHIDNIKAIWLEMFKNGIFENEKHNAIKLEFKKLNLICENDFFKEEREKIKLISNEIIIEIEKYKYKKFDIPYLIIDKIVDIEYATGVWAI